MYYTVIAYCN